MAQKQRTSHKARAPKVERRALAFAMNQVRNAEASIQALAEEEARWQDRESVINHAIEVIGDEPEAMRWLGSPVLALEYATPISLLNSSEGQAAVLKLLTQLEHGVL